MDKLPSDREAVRRAALEEAAKEADKQALMATSVAGHCNCNVVVARRIRELLNQPADAEKQ